MATRVGLTAHSMTLWSVAGDPLFNVKHVKTVGSIFRQASIPDADGERRVRDLVILAIWVVNAWFHLKHS